MMEPPEGFEWHQRDASELRCVDCGEIVRAGVVDLHRCEVEDCTLCGGDRPPGCTAVVDGERVPVCPSCEDHADAARTHDYQPGDPTGRGRVPPHGNTTR